ncbi:MAG: hypothetical protein LBB47_06960 [Spirochaetaceae bacterium]|jgi:epoxyqueuosine reductase|nr:hypothetical protein [Spirochaetaceae bacterium]
MIEYKKYLCEAALRLGFSRARVLSPFDPVAFRTRRPCKLPENYSTGAKSLLVCALPYGNRYTRTVLGGGPEAVHGVIAPFARFNYYREAVNRMKHLSTLLRARYGGEKSDYRILCNSPVPEKPLAEACGLGAAGRNGLIISYETGSLFIIAAMTLPYALESDQPLKPPLQTGPRDGEAPVQFPLCGNCAGGPSGKPPCVAACPTGAVLGNGRVDLEKCIQWYASGHGAPEIPAPVLAVWGKRLYGCASCQDACIHNIRPIKGVQTDQGALPEFIDVRALLKLSDAEIKAMFKGTAMGLSWLGPRSIRRNAEAVLQYVSRFNSGTGRRS